MKRAFVFPGQGSQTVGMGRALAEAFAPARHLFEEIDDALSQHLSRLMFEGPQSELLLTENAQPALLAASLAVMRVLEEEADFDLARQVAFVAGHSLGEYSALAAAHALSAADAARLLKRRGQAMQKAVPLGEGAMAALIGTDVEEAREITEEAERASGLVCAVANDNAPGQTVISGHKGAVDRAASIAGAKGKRSIPLPVSAPFHSPLMAPAAEAMAEALSAVTFDPPLVPLVSNVTASALRDPAAIKERLVEQVTAMVRWRECVLCLRAQQVEELVEIGAGRVLAGLAKRIDRDLGARSVGAPPEVDALIKDL